MLDRTVDGMGGAGERPSVPAANTPYAPPVYPPTYPPIYPPMYSAVTQQEAAPVGTQGVYPDFAPDGAVRPELLRQPQPAPRRRGGWRGALVAAGSLLLAVVTKVGLLLKALLPALSAIVSVAAYAALFGWQFGVGLVTLLFIHEMGHFVVIRAKGLPASLPVFIPLVGAYVTMRRMPSNVTDEAEIAIAGPVAGWLAGLGCFALYMATHTPVLLPLAYFSFLINLINLIPVSPLDGGRIVGAISRWVWPLGLIGVGVAFWYTHNFLLLALALLGVGRLFGSFPANAENARYFKTSALMRALITLSYIGLAAALLVGMSITHQMIQAQGLNVRGF